MQNIQHTSAGALLRAANGAQVTVCPAFSAGTPCAPKSNLFDKNGVAVNNPVTADVNGNYGFCVNTPGRYLIQIGGTGFTTFVQDNSILPNDPVSPVFTGGITSLGNISLCSSCTLLFGDTPDTGISRSIFSPGVFMFGNSGFNNTSGTIQTSFFQGANGALTTPTFSFISSPNTGMWWDSGNARITWGIAGATVMDASASVLSLRGLGLGFGVPRDAGIVRTAASTMQFGAGNGDATGILVATKYNAADGTAAAPAYTFSSHTGSGFGNITGFDAPVVSVAGAYKVFWLGAEHRMSSTEVDGWSSGTDPSIASMDTNFTRASGGVVQVGTGNTANSAGEFDARTIGVTGATSGKTTIVTAAIASGTQTLQATTGTVADINVAQSWTGNQSNMALVTPTISGTVTSYDGFTTVGAGLPPIVATADATAQTANIASTPLISLGPGGGGIYNVEVYIIVTSVGTTSTLPAVNIIYTDRDNNTSQTVPFTTTNAGNTLTTLALNSFPINVKASTTISFSTSGYASTGTPMQYAVHIKVLALL